MHFKNAWLMAAAQARNRFSIDRSLSVVPKEKLCPGPKWTCILQCFCQKPRLSLKHIFFDQILNSFFLAAHWSIGKLKNGVAFLDF